jgi:hypothetical protein
MELYSHEEFMGYSLFVEVVEIEDETFYEGVAKLNGKTIFNSSSTISGDHAENQLKHKIYELED